MPYFGEQVSAGAGYVQLCTYISRAYTEELKLFCKMKRKELDEVYNDSSPSFLSNPSRKFQRLDAESVSVMDENQNVNAPHFVERGLLPELPWTSTSMMLTDVASVETLPRSNATEERALLPYDTANSSFPKYPSLQNFPIVVQSDLIPGLKACLSSWGISKLENSEEDGKSKEKSSEGSIGNLAVVPFVASHWPVVCEERLSAACEPLEAEGQMMDMDEPYLSRSEDGDMEIGEKTEELGISPPCLQQHHMMLSLLQNSLTRMMW